MSAWFGLLAWALLAVRMQGGLRCSIWGHYTADVEREDAGYLRDEPTLRCPLCGHLHNGTWVRPR